MPSQTTLLGAAGEYYVMSELLRRGYIAALTPSGVPQADLLVTDLSGNRLCSIQVKTRSAKGSDGGWHMGAKHEEIRSDKLFYCFVDMGDSENARPQVFIVPSVLVADALKSSHHHWLNTPGKHGRVRNDSQMRRFLPDYSNIFSLVESPFKGPWLERYRSAWNLLQLEASDSGTSNSVAHSD